jgi:hypothetical protein
MALNLFIPQVDATRLHQVFLMVLKEQFAPERKVLEEWANAFVDRDGKFVKEFQTTFESGLWELYLHACLRQVGAEIDFSVASPDFVIKHPVRAALEATIAAPAVGGKAAYGWGIGDIPEDINQFNRDAVLRICNSFTSKVRRYRDYYVTLDHVKDTPFVISIAAFDRPMAHLAANRPILAALYGVYFDEELTMTRRSGNVISYDVDEVVKSDTATVPLGLFTTDAYSDVSAVVYSAVATWGKVRALADNPEALTVYTTLHPNPGGLYALRRVASKRDYREDLLDGLHILHNPFAKVPLGKELFNHPRVAQYFVESAGRLCVEAPDDFLLVRMLQSVVAKP